ncbi:unnamed protein product [Allacma fusca]|uniref:Uncharacterized protein n=1 Tax=Allacma fusca TaxID=39272 RepID=A0A8J2KPM4_9HEXA|nr:unnamed protein product [Allacma fusca]
MDISAILPDEDLVFEGEGEATQAVGSIGQVHHPRDPLSHLIRSDTDTSSDSLDEMENSDDIGIDAIKCPRPLCCSSPIKSPQSKTPMLDYSKLSSRDPSGFEGNGNGGDMSIIEPVVLQNEIAELRYQNRKLNEEVQELRSQNAAYDDHQTSLLAQKEDLEKKVGSFKAHTEKIRQITKELEETKVILSRCEDTNVIYSKRIQRLERDNNVLLEEADGLRSKITSVIAENERYRFLLKEQELQTNTFKVLSNERINELIISREEVEEQLKIASRNLDDYINSNEQLRMEKQELENNLLAAQELQLDSKLASLEATALADNTFDEEDLISFRASSCTPVPNSLHAEIAASLRRDSCEFPKFRHDSLITLKTSDGSLPWDLESPEFSHRVLSVLTEILEDLQLLRSETSLESSRKEEKGKGGDSLNVDADGSVVETVQSPKESETIEQVAAVVDSSPRPETSPKEVDVVRRIHEELAEFRAQLKKSQELFHAFNTSQTFDVTKSCPLLADETDTDASPTNILKPQFVTIATQTEAPVIASSSQTNPVAASCLSVEKTESSDDIDELSCYINKLSLDDNELDKLSLDDDSYRLPINLPTVLEESEHETETSPATLHRRMSSDKSKKFRLTRMSPMDEPIKSGDESEFYSPVSTLPSSKNTSTYNSLERPLQFSGGSGNNPGGEEYHDISDSTYNSPMSSPSYYWTPSQGSSSEETIANHDGDRTPVNEHDNIFGDETNSCPDPSYSPTLLRKRSKPIGKLGLPIDDRSNLSNEVLIDESDRDRLTRFAYDVVARSTKRDASILDRGEWRTLKQDLQSKKVSQYNKGVAQEEGTDNDIADAGPILSGITADLDDEAEEYIFEMHFPDVVESLFESLDKFKIKERKDFRPSERDHRNIKEKFMKLSQVFKTDHATLSLRERASRNEMKSLKTGIDEILKSFKQSVDSLQQNLDTYDNQDIVNDLDSIKQNSLELEGKSKALTDTAMKVGSIDLEKRVYKLIEVMVLYVHILKHYEIPDKEQKPPLDDDHMEALPARTSNGSITSNNNNNNEKGRTGGYLGEGQRMERWFEAGSEFIRRELSWPWNWEQTWKGVKQCFSILLMLTGLLIIFKSVFPIVSADGSNCNGQPMNPFASIAKHSSLIHEERPTL